MIHHQLVKGGAVGSRENITSTIVGIGVGGVTRSTEQLALVVVGIGNSALSGGGIGGNVTHAVIGIAILPARWSRMPPAGWSWCCQYPDRYTAGRRGRR